MLFKDGDFILAAQLSVYIIIGQAAVAIAERRGAVLDGRT